MAKLPIDARLKVERMIEDRVVAGERRGYLGVSSIGKECPRALWYDFRFCSKAEFPARLDRLFKRGHREEPIIIADLKSIGVEVLTPNQMIERGYKVVTMANGERQTEVIAGYGHIKGHGDGIGENIPDAPKTPHYLEFKTMADKYFNQLKEKGVDKAQPVYSIQCQAMMALLNLKRTLFIAVNKNTDERYYERLRLEKNTANYWIKRAENIILSEFPPVPYDSFKCNWCDHKNLCKSGAAPLQNCRTCRFCDMENKGKWSCSKSGDWLQLDDQIEGCSYWKKLECLGV